jgi:hypothetical protein
MKSNENPAILLKNPMGKALPLVSAGGFPYNTGLGVCFWIFIVKKYWSNKQCH